jgi:hypothetical protein
MMRGTLVRTLEWRARRFSDPARRLQFLRRKPAEAGRPRECVHGDLRGRYARYLRSLSATGITFLVMLTNTHTTAVLPDIAHRAPAAKSHIWMVQTTPRFDLYSHGLYSNGLWIEERYATSTARRRYMAFPSSYSGPIAAAGIVYHTTESHLAPFEEDQNQMLRARYGIPVSNCVAHVQVSINPANHGVGYHLDWAANLPFAELGLADDYRLALPSVRPFGFEPPDALREAAASSIAQGLEAAEIELRADGAAQNLPVGRYREKLQKRYRDAIRALRGKDAYQEYN